MTVKNNISVWIHGETGKMGVSLKKLFPLTIKDTTFSLVGGSHSKTKEDDLREGIKKSDLIFEFSTIEGHKQLFKILEHQDLKHKSILVGTTSLPPVALDQCKSLARMQQLKILVAPNTSVGVLLTLKSAMSVAMQCFENNFDIEILESHHREKKDAPSGTAQFLASALSRKLNNASLVSSRVGKRQQGEIGIHSLRGGGGFGEHTISFLGDQEEISITHRAYTRDLFAKGAFALGGWLIGQDSGVYGLLDVEL